MTCSRVVFYYVSGHGFGHAARSAEIIGALKKIDPDIRVFIRTNAPPFLFEKHMDVCRIDPVSLDVGVVQRNSLNMDIPATISAWHRLDDRLNSIIERELEAVLRHGARLLVSDIPAAAFRISRRAGIPGIAVSNFSWDWIYRGWVDNYPEAADIADRIHSDYELCDLLLKLPFSGLTDAFRKVEPVPMVARTAGLSGDEVRRRLGLARGRPLVLLSFGDMAHKIHIAPDTSTLKTFQLISTNQLSAGGCRILRASELHRMGIGYPDLVAASDIVISKPGYGIVTECIANSARLLYTNRGPFREYDILTKEMNTWLPVQFIPQKELISGNWFSFLTSLMVQRFPAHEPDISGAGCIARRFAYILKE